MNASAAPIGALVEKKAAAFATSEGEAAPRAKVDGLLR
jgi:hypothetical protein